jgi:beta-glucosidase
MPQRPGGSAAGGLGNLPAVLRRIERLAAGLHSGAGGVARRSAHPCARNCAVGVAVVVRAKNKFMDVSLLEAPFRNSELSRADRVADLLDRMTLAEKVAQIGCTWSVFLVENEAFSEERAREMMADGAGQVTRIAAATGLRPRENAAFMNQIQRFLRDETRLAIPALVHEESVGGFTARDADQLPQGIGLAATWNPDLVQQGADLIRQQMLAVGARLGLSPVLDVARDPRWGRVEESYGEDPYLAARMGVAYVRGLQGDDLTCGVAATGKHFIGYGVSEGGHNHKPAHIGSRALREVYARPFLAAIHEAGLCCMMNAYNEIDGLPCGGSAEILDDLLRGELGFNGLVVADYFTTNQLITAHRVAETKSDAALMALKAGLDCELPSTDCYSRIERLVEKGALEESLVDRSVARVLDLKFALGLFENPFVEEEIAAASYQTPEARGLARKLAAQSVVLLENDGTLPLRADLKRIAVIGPAADDERLLEGDYHYPAHLEIIYRSSEDDAGAILPRPDKQAFAAGPFFPPMVTPLAGLRAALPEATVTTARGCGVSSMDESGIPAAVEAASSAEVAVVFVGGRSGLVPGCTSGEFRDSSHLELTGVQQKLVAAVIATGRPTVVVLVGGRIFAVPEMAGRAGALVAAFLPGEEGGHGIADVLTGAVDASGRLPVSMLHHAGQIPLHSGRKWDAGSAMGNFESDYIDGAAEALYPFGHGLSYTQFRCTDAEVRTGTTADTCPLEVECMLHNVGTRDGVEVLRLEIQDLVASVTRPVCQLAGFARIELAAGASVRVHFQLDRSQLGLYDRQMQFVVEPGDVRYRITGGAVEAPIDGVASIGGDIVALDAQQIIPTEVIVEA